MKALLSCFLLLFTFNTHAETLIEHNGVSVTEADVIHYFKDRVPDVALRSAVSNTHKYEEIIENIYVIKAMAKQAELELDDANHSLWVAELEKDRVLMQELLKQKLKQKSDDVNWNSYALEEYTANPERYNSGEKVSASHILLNREGKTAEELQNVITEVYQGIAKGEDFAKLALEYSQDKSAKTNSGYLGYFARNQMVKPFADAVFAMKEPGSISKPVTTQFGVHIIKYHDRQGPKKLPFEKVKAEIIKQGKERERNSLHKRLVMEVKSSTRAKVVALDYEKLEEVVRSELRIPKEDTPNIGDILKNKNK